MSARNWLRLWLLLPLLLLYALFARPSSGRTMHAFRWGAVAHSR